MARSKRILTPKEIQQAKLKPYLDALEVKTLYGISENRLKDLSLGDEIVIKSKKITPGRQGKRVYVHDDVMKFMVEGTP